MHKRDPVCAESRGPPGTPSQQPPRTSDTAAQGGLRCSGHCKNCPGPFRTPGGGRRREAPSTSPSPSPPPTPPPSLSPPPPRRPPPEPGSQLAWRECGPVQGSLRTGPTGQRPRQVPARPVLASGPPGPAHPGSEARRALRSLHPHARPVLGVHVFKVSTGNAGPWSLPDADILNHLANSSRLSLVKPQLPGSSCKWGVTSRTHTGPGLRPPTLLLRHPWERTMEISARRLVSGCQFRSSGFSRRLAATFESLS